MIEDVFVCEFQKFVVVVVASNVPVDLSDLQCQWTDDITQVFPSVTFSQ